MAKERVAVFSNSDFAQLSDTANNFLQNERVKLISTAVSTVYSGNQIIYTLALTVEITPEPSGKYNVS